MNFKLNALVATLVMAASAPAFADIDKGVQGNGDLFFSIWDSANSYSRDLNITINDFEAAVAASGSINLNFTADATFTSFMSSANASELKWNIVGTDQFGARRVLETFTPPPFAPTMTNDIVRTLAASTANFAADLNQKLSCGVVLSGCNPLGGNSATYAVGTVGYAGDVNVFADDNAGLLNFKNNGTSSTNSIANSLGLMRINAASTGIANSTYNPYLDGGNAVGVYLDANNTLHITAVPEAETYAMMLAGLGLVGFMVRRRNNFV